jgi:hypothetical protein
MELKGKIYKIFNVEQISDKFKKRDFVLEHSDNPSYPQYSKFQLNQNNVELIEGYSVGDDVKILFNLRGKEYETKNKEIAYFNTLEVYKLEGATGASSPTSSPIKSGSDVINVSKQEEDDDLPF